MKIIKQEQFWTRDQVANDPDHYYIFGDNEAGWGRAGQACIRGLENAYGIPTLASPGVFWSDDDYEGNVVVIDQAIARIPTDKPWIVSAHGLGTGLAMLDKKAPKTFAYLERRMAELEEK